MTPPHQNILLITLDQWRTDRMSILGHPCLDTPGIDALARDGVLFRNHFTVALPCGPVRASLLTGSISTITNRRATAWPSTAATPTSRSNWLRPDTSRYFSASPTRPRIRVISRRTIRGVVRLPAWRRTSFKGCICLATPGHGWIGW
jgi:hypothetical protein